MAQHNFSVNNSHQITGALAGGDIDNDGLVEIVAPGSGMAYVYENDGALIFTVTGLAATSAAHRCTSHCRSQWRWERDHHGRASSVTKVKSWELGHMASENPFQMGATPSVADLDVDGMQEVVVEMHLSMDGTAICNNGNNDGYTAVGDFDNDGQGEVVVSSRMVVRLQGSGALWFGPL